jgi:uncharacterized membrane protein YphA (DoxX/SURF4 family)
VRPKVAAIVAPLAPPLRRRRSFEQGRRNQGDHRSELRAHATRTSRTTAARKVDSGSEKSNSTAVSRGGARPSFGLVLVRVAAGMFPLHAGLRAGHDGYSGDLVTATADGWSAAPECVHVWGDFVLRHPSLFAELGVWGAIVLGAALFLGLLTRPAGILAACLCVNIALAEAGLHRATAALLAVCAAGCALSSAGRSAGADACLESRLPWWLTWTRA